MSIENVDLVIGSLVIIVYFIAFYKIFVLTKKIYGGRFSSLIPQLSAGTSLMLLNAIFKGAAQPLFPVFQESAAFNVGLGIIQIIAGIFFLSVFYQLYNIRFVTAGFFGAKEEPSEISEKKMQKRKR